MNSTCSSEAANLTMDHLGGHQVWEVILIVLVTGPLSLLTILGNLLVVISIKVNGQLQTIGNYYLLSLALADLILGTVSMNLYTAYIIMGQWTLGHLACDLWLTLDYVASNASVMNLLVISFDRYLSVTRPLTYRSKRTPRTAAVLIAFAWVVSFVLWGPAILFWPHVVGRPSGAEAQVCSIPFLKVPPLTYGTAIAAFYLPVSIMIILYWRIYWEIEKRAKGLAGLVGSVKQSTDGLSGYQINASQSNQRISMGCLTGKQNSQRSKKLVQTSTGLSNSTYKETGSNSSWNVEDEDETISSSNDEDHNLKGPSSDPGVELEDLENKYGVGQKQESTNLQAPVNPDHGKRQQLRVKRRITMIISEKKAARTLSAILLAFILTWTPYNIMVLASISYCVPERLWQLGYWLCYVNSTVNPMCYALCNESFRDTFKALLLCRNGDQRRWFNKNSKLAVKRSCSGV